MVAGAHFVGTTSRGFTKEQLYSTASYESGDLHGIGLNGNDFWGWNLADLNLTDADFRSATLTGTDLSRADTRGARLASWDGAITDDTLLPDGHIARLRLAAGETLKVRDYDGGIAVTIDAELTLDPAAVLQVVLSDADWGSTISLADGVTADLDGTLHLGFAAGAHVEGLLGTPFDLFDWNGGLLAGDAFASVAWPAGFDWDLSDLYLGGAVTLTAVPEPGTAVLLLCGLLTGGLRRRETRTR